MRTAREYLQHYIRAFVRVRRGHKGDPRTITQPKHPPHYATTATYIAGGIVYAAVTIPVIGLITIAAFVIYKLTGIFLWQAPAVTPILLFYPLFLNKLISVDVNHVGVPRVLDEPIPWFYIRHGKSWIPPFTSVIEQDLREQELEVSGEAGKVVALATKTDAETGETILMPETTVPVFLKMVVTWWIANAYQSLRVGERLVKERELSLEEVVGRILPGLVLAVIRNYARTRPATEIIVIDATAVHNLFTPPWEDDAQINFIQTCDSWGICVRVAIDQTRYSKELEEAMELVMRERMELEGQVVAAQTTGKVSQVLGRLIPGLRPNTQLDASQAITGDAIRNIVAHDGEGGDSLTRAADTIFAGLTSQKDGAKGSPPRNTDRKKE